VARGTTAAGHRLLGEKKGRGAPPPREVREGRRGPAWMGKMEKQRNSRCNNGGGSPEKRKFAGAEQKFADWG
jgi:hypothetical protein